MQIDWDKIHAMWSSDNPGWRLIPHDWMWYTFWDVAVPIIVVVPLFGLVEWVNWMWGCDND